VSRSLSDDARHGEHDGAEPTYVGAYWGARAESVGSCAERLARFLSLLGRADAALGQWYLKGPNRNAARRPVAGSERALVDLLSRGRNHRDVGGELIEELGFSASMWNGGTPAVALSATIGAFPRSAGILNHCLLELPAPVDHSGALYADEVAMAVFRAFVTCWRPSWATWTTNRLRTDQHAAPGTPIIGWRTYLAGTVPGNGSAPGGVSTCPVADGTLVTLGARIEDVSSERVSDARRWLALP